MIDLNTGQTIPWITACTASSAAHYRERCRCERLRFRVYGQTLILRAAFAHSGPPELDPVGDLLRDHFGPGSRGCGDLWSLAISGRLARNPGSPFPAGIRVRP